MTEYLVPTKNTEAKIHKLRIKLDDAYKESIELGAGCFKKGDGEKEVRKHIEKALSNYRWRLMEIMKLQMTENEMN
ncbi:hypothetical protein A2Z67_04545 [Candidatus Woesebacteria bacterium RBG_13_36_22]|uniref:Uncharacterized protein n=1 Tax=Candidatus Woesebacteria bacterium RBG_13_36_22 TaxID=1802478 RepID=A0A1F7X2I5_9BACT|nr:MAG: hypothetical protein A2Z67_04545 [Candidatus Woesebacteria bacterium RBG_13_36_22]